MRLGLRNKVYQRLVYRADAVDEMLNSLKREHREGLQSLQKRQKAGLKVYEQRDKWCNSRRCAEIANLKVERRAIQIGRAFMDNKPLSSVETYWYGLSYRQMTYSFIKHYGGGWGSYLGRYSEASFKQHDATERAMILLRLAVKSQNCDEHDMWLRYRLDVLDEDYLHFVDWLEYTHGPEFYRGEILDNHQNGKMVGETPLERWRRMAAG